MWYDTLKEYWINTDMVLEERLMEIAESHNEVFDPDELIDEICPSVNYFGKVFYPTQIIKKLDLHLYFELRYGLIEDWIEEVKYILERSEPKEGDTLADFCVSRGPFYELENIVWKERE